MNLTPENTKRCYLAPQGYLSNLKDELREISAELDHLVVSSSDSNSPVWCQNTWLAPQVIKIESISDAAKKLKALGRNWALYPYGEFRRAKLIEEQLPHVSFKPVKFPSALPSAPLGSWTLLDRDTILASPLCSSPYPNGIPSFLESKTEPPSRAYLKLWETFTLFQKMPEKGERCLDAGACPGGWSWVLASLGAEVLAIDRAPIDPRISSMKGVSFKKGDALSLGPEELGQFDWVFSDVICYPERLYDWVNRWREAKAAKNFICTLKFQGQEHYHMIDKFRAIANSKVIHLSVNKHELTFILFG